MEKGVAAAPDHLRVVAISAIEPEIGNAMAAALAQRLAAEHDAIEDVSRPDASPVLCKEGLLCLDTKQLTTLMNQVLAGITSTTAAGEEVNLAASAAFRIPIDSRDDSADEPSFLT